MPELNEVFWTFFRVWRSRDLFITLFVSSESETCSWNFYYPKVLEILYILLCRAHFWYKVKLFWFVRFCFGITCRSRLYLQYLKANKRRCRSTIFHLEGSQEKLLGSRLAEILYSAKFIGQLYIWVTFLSNGEYVTSLHTAVIFLIHNE